MAKKKGRKKKAAKKKGLKKKGKGLKRKRTQRKRGRGADPIQAARRHLRDALYGVFTSASTLSDADEIIEGALREARRTMLEEWYRDNPDDLAEDSGWDINTDDPDDVENQSADYVGSMSDEEVIETLEACS